MQKTSNGYEHSDISKKIPTSTVNFPNVNLTIILVSGSVTTLVMLDIAHCLKHINLLTPTGYVMHHQFNIQQLYALPTLYLCVLYLSENKQRLLPLTA